MIGDADVHAFYAKLLDQYGKAMKQEAVELLTDLVEAGKPQDGKEIEF